jgi:hypothetical protein
VGKHRQVRAGELGCLTFEEFEMTIKTRMQSIFFFNYNKELYILMSSVSWKVIAEK